jgi:exodeoxyribonuclease V alpha subunit
VDLAQTLLEIPGELVGTALGLELEAGEVVADTLEEERCVFVNGGGILERPAE